MERGRERSRITRAVPVSLGLRPLAWSLSLPPSYIVICTFDYGTSKGRGDGPGECDESERENERRGFRISRAIKERK